MASSISAFWCAALALVLWTAVGWAFAQRLSVARNLILPIAPTLGWAIQNVIAWTAASAGGMSWVTLLIIPALISALVFILFRKPESLAPDEGRFPAWILIGATIVALAPAAAVLPKFSGDSVFLAAPIYDHSKVALIDEIVRGGVPPANPIFGAGGGAGRVAYYYLWHFGAAQLAYLLGASGWEADIAATWFTAFASLALMCGLAFHFSKRAWSAVLVVALACGGSLRPVLDWVFGQARVDAVLLPPSGMEGWLFQTSWSPHHVASAGCVLLATLLMVQLARRPSLFGGLVLAVMLAAGFASSIWVGGIVFAIAGCAIGLALVVTLERRRRWQFLAVCFLAAVGAAILVSPLIVEQAHAAVARDSGFPIVIRAIPVFGELIPEAIRRTLDLPGYWLVLLVVEFPAIVVAGAVALMEMSRLKEIDPARKTTIAVLAALALVSFGSAWLLVSTAGENNDLGWRAILPGIMVLTVGASVGIVNWFARPFAVGAALAGLALALPGGLSLIAGNVMGDPTSQGNVFAQDPDMWAAVRKYTPADARVANNPEYLKTLAPWTINISWALLSDRRSCWGGFGLAVAFVSLPKKRMEDSEVLFRRVFNGHGTAADVASFARDYGCRTILITSKDGAWTRDPFKASELYHLAETKPDRWRIYVARNDRTINRP